MAATRGLSIDGINYLADVINNPTAKPDWMKIGTTTAQLTGNYKIIEFISGFKGLQNFTFTGRNWTIGGMAFDGIMRTDHQSHVRTTNYPVQTGVTMTDHAIVEPAELSIDIMMTDTAGDILTNDILGNFVDFGVTNLLGKTAGTVAKIAMNANKMVQNALQQSTKGIFGSMTQQNTGLGSLFGELSSPSAISSVGNGRSVNAWQALKSMQLERAPLTVTTRLQTYENMIIEELSAPDDYQTLNALKCTVHLKQIIFANVAETTVSKRAAASAELTNGGQTAVQKVENKTALKKASEVAGGILG
jgi:hypothetical protein